MSYSNSCVCGEKFTNNCAHFLSNWMIKNGDLSPNPSGTYCCKSGRPVRAKEMRNVFTNELGLSRSFNPPSGNCYIYCEYNSNHQGHVYYGTKSYCEAGTGSGTDFDMDYYEYYS